MATSSPTRALLRERRFVLLASARTISVLGDGFARVALAFGVIAIPGSTPAQLSLVLACQAVPQLLLILVGGAPLWTIVVAMFAAGVAGDVFGVLWTTTMQREVPADALSRVSSYDWFGSLALAPLGILAAGPVAAAVGPGAALLGCSGLVVVATLAALLSPQVRTLRAPDAEERAPDAEEDVRPASGETAGRTHTSEGGQGLGTVSTQVVEAER
ncbi:hypothetical protein [Streptosporangium vulgare]|uniref:MFS transporter n=1 Tax=Streptosporangium vulgare TaxID=46190 RepID=A0ABV5TMS7_9ACTN